MRVLYTGLPQIFPDLGPWELVSGNVVDLPEGLEESFLTRGDFSKAEAKAKLSKLSLPLAPPSDEEVAPEPVPIQGADVIEEASARTD